MPFFLRTWLDPKVPVVVLVLPEWVAPNPPTEPALKPKFDWVVVLLKSWGTHMTRSPHYHVLGSSLGSLSPQAFLATKYWASLTYSIGYHLLTSVLEDYH